jgi:hypothetical protein
MAKSLFPEIALVRGRQRIQEQAYCGAFEARAFRPDIPFLWSGANSVQERDKAARELVEHIRAKQSDHPSSTQVVIAHSHGGNVALRALDQLGVTRNEIFIATIDTPFVEILRTKLSPTDTARVDVMVSATTAILVPQYVVHARYAFFPTLDTNVFGTLSVPLRAGCLLAQGQEPGRACGHARGRGGVEL